MRHYSQNSSEAMARILALTMLADGGLDKTELEAIAKSKILNHIEMTEAGFEKVVHELCDDLLQYSSSYSLGQIELDRETLNHVFADITLVPLQKMLLKVMVAVVDADQRMSDGEAIVISQALSTWGFDLVEVVNPQSFVRHSAFAKSLFPLAHAY